MSVTDANPPHPTFIDDYVLHQVDNEWLEAAEIKQFILHRSTECITEALIFVLGNVST